MYKKHTQDPKVVTASVIGLVYENGVIIAADNLASYGSLAKYPNTPRVFKVNKNTILGVGGDHADFQHVWKYIEQKQFEESSEGRNLSPLALHTWLTRLQYSRRNKFDPLWIECVVGGIQNGEPYLGYVNKLGLSYQDKAIGTGRLGSLSYPILKEYTDDFKMKLTEEKARELIVKSLEILYYRDCYTSPKYSLAIVSKDKESVVEESLKLTTNWSVATYKVKA